MSIDEILSGATCWDDIHAAIKRAPTTKAQGALFEEFCQLFLLTESDEYENEDVRLYDKIQPSIAERLKLTGGDHGVDILARSKDGRFIGAQCKWRGDSGATLGWSKDKLANLFAHDTLDGFIIMSNAVSVDKHSRKVDKLERTILYGELNQIDADRIANMRRIARGERTQPSPKHTPRADQTEAINAVVNGFANADRGQLILPCGAGKTLTALWIKEKMNAKRTLVLVPSLALLRQTKETWRAQSDKPFKYLCVCSETDIDKDDYDAPVSAIHEIGPSGVGVFQDNADIKRALSEFKETDDAVVFATYQSSDKLRGLRFELAVCDEAHKTATKKASNFALIHADKNIHCDKRLYMTATPRVLGNRREGKGDGDIISNYIHDMSDKRVFGEELHRLSFAEAIEREILCDYKVILLETSEVIARENGERRRRTLSQDTLFAILEKTVAKYGARKTITFHHRIPDARKFSAALNAKGVKADFVSGEQSTGEREKRLKEFADSDAAAVVANARCLTEGVDVPDIDMVYFCSPRRSKTDIVQAVGRALRRADGKKFGYVLVPIVHYIEDKAELHARIQSGAYDGDYKEVITVLNALQDHDKRLSDEIHARFHGKASPNSASIVERIFEEVGFSDINPYDLKLAKDASFSRILAKTTPSKFLSFEDARAFAHSLNLKSRSGWVEFIKSGQLPDDIPANPDRTYNDKGWISWGDWLGTGNIANFNKEFRSFEDAREFARSLKLKSKGEWIEFAQSDRKPLDIPSVPKWNYKNQGWNGYGDWLGTGAIAPQDRVYRSFEEARAFARSLNLKNRSGWFEFTKSGQLPDDIPANPNQTYENQGWIEWGDWLGTGYKHKKDFLPFEEARAFARNLDLKTQKEWFAFTKSGKLPKNIPVAPNLTYKNKGWIDWGDWLGTGYIALQNRKYRSFEKAREFARGLNLETQKEWFAFTKSGKLPKDIPVAPNLTYKNKGWNGMGDWLGTGYIATFNRNYRSFEDAREFARKLNFKNQSEWFDFTKSGQLPDDIPVGPRNIYKGKGWKGWGD